MLEMLYLLKILQADFIKMN